MAEKKMTDMMLTPQEQKEQLGVPTAVTDEEERYPYGLKIRLQDEELEKLGIKENIESGKPVTLQAVGYVCDEGSSSSVDAGGRQERYICIQITDLAVEEGVEEDEEDEEERGEKRASAMYPAAEAKA